MTNQNIATSGRAEGRRRRDNALSAVETHRSALIRRGEQAWLLVLLRRGRCSADDVRAELGELTGDVRWLGVPPKRLHAAGTIQFVGYVPSERAVNHGRPIGVWELVDRAAGEARLRELNQHPAPQPILSQPPLWG